MLPILPAGEPTPTNLPGSVDFCSSGSAAWKKGSGPKPWTAMCSVTAARGAVATGVKSVAMPAVGEDDVAVCDAVGWIAGWRWRCAGRWGICCRVSSAGRGFGEVGEGRGRWCGWGRVWAEEVGCDEAVADA